MLCDTIKRENQYVPAPVTVVLAHATLPDQVKTQLPLTHWRPCNNEHLSVSRALGSSVDMEVSGEATMD